MPSGGILSEAGAASDQGRDALYPDAFYPDAFNA